MSIFEKEKNLFVQVYKRFPLHIVSGQGVWLKTVDGHEYLDLLAGIAVNALGYNHSAILQAIEKQYRKNLHLSNYFIQDIQVELAERLIQLSGYSKIFLTNSGTEAIEGILKLVKKWGRLNNKKTIISLEGSFHGRTLGAVSITGQAKYKQNFTPLIPEIKTIPHNDIEALTEAIDENTAAFFFEGITGEGGIRPLSDEYILRLIELREKYNFLIIGDEIQTGVGRTGTFFFYQSYDFLPDAIATAKGIGGGLPLGAFLIKDHLNGIFSTGEHGSTYGGNPLACATGLAVVDIVSQKSFLKKVLEKGSYFLKELTKLKDQFPFLCAARGKGLMLGLEVDSAERAKRILDKAFENRIIFNLAGNGKVLRFVPPLIIEKEHIDFAVQRLQKIFLSLN